jgi:manganese/zinc/iron transport system substrate-binding protein
LNLNGPVFRYYCLVGLFALVGGTLILGCKPSRSSTTPLSQRETAADLAIQPIRVVATVGMVADIVREVGGSRVRVHQLMGPGVDPHLYKGTRDDVRAILAADLVFYSGLMLEGKLIDMLEKVSSKKPVTAITSSLPADLILSESESLGHADPHAWMDVSLWAKCVDVVADALIAYDAEHSDTYRENAKRYEAQLMSLDKYGKDVIATVPQEGRVLITSHDAFAYFGRAYGLDVFGVQGLSTDSEAGLRQINSLVDTIVARKVSAVFVESSVPRKSILAVVDGAASRGHRVKIGGELYSDAMGQAATYEGTYLGMLDHNLTLVARALGGNAPARGMLGRLREASGEES